jgi:hypothetical protein
MPYYSDALHQIVLHTVHQRPLLEGETRKFAELALRNLPNRYPGLKIVESAVFPARVEMLLDFHRLDEDVLRVLQSYKLEVKSMSKAAGFKENHFWQWNYEDHLISPEIRGA